MKQIKLTQGKIAMVDDSDFEWLNRVKWHAVQDGNTFYAHHHLNSKQLTFRMHREILGLRHGDKRQCDHQDGNGLNNQRSNLRICMHQQNQQNQRLRKVATSKYKGVSWIRRVNKWQAGICVNRKQLFLGYFDNEIEAAKAYDKKAKQSFREFAYVNFEEDQ